ncbi:N-acetylglucosamine kinase [Cyanobium sp. CH-040]|uniref:N-acetylglucosamine kinase n=1 Tax=Cyanobium sp. CH-040 TaxID=2823708 RepID=UPI0020CC22F9|nr:BadF/BadG/BcrA/BcrD ATPase family protein [Cyanobium sp. CH-040]MCP9927351.1 N-acetylglucosamine kinase [Cyanobium sp. CH-040]
MADLIAGFDAGQSHTRCRLAQAEGVPVLCEGEGPGVRHLASPGGAEAFQQALRLSLSRALEALDPAQRVRLLAAAVGASGIEVGSPVQEQGLRLAAAALDLPLECTAVTGDERTALRGAMGPASEGVLLISGTGTIAVGRNRQGAEHRCAGWGWLLDGAGSAMDIGRDGLSASLEMADGRRPDSDLREGLWEALGLSARAPGAAAAIKARVVQPEFGAAGFAALAPVVAAAAAAGDPTAGTIVRRNAEALAAMAITISRRLNLEAPPIWPLGGALEHLPPLRQALEQALALGLPSARLARPAGDACAGALSLARALPELRRH